jgi:hypothetical protein
MLGLETKRSSIIYSHVRRSMKTQVSSRAIYVDALPRVQLRTWEVETTTSLKTAVGRITSIT